MKTSFNKYLYIGFVLFALYELMIKHSAAEAATQLGIALIFDPFDQAQPWKERPTWQRGVLFVHLAILAGLVGYEVGSSGDLIQGIKDGWNGK
jgi:H+/Cl- antiporter ClcA